MSDLKTGTVADIAAVPTKRILDKELYERLRSMFLSGDKGNYPIAEQILIECDIEKSAYYMWKLLKGDGVSYKLNRRLKRVREFIHNKHVSKYSYCGVYNFALYIKTEKLLTPEVWEMLKPEITDIVKKKSHNDFYDVELKLRDLYA